MGGESVDGRDAAAALQVIVLGSGGGPLESNTTAFLVRSLSSGWRKGSIIALDAGVQLSAITRILRETQPPDLGQTDELALPHTLASGPFKGLEIPFASAEANAAHIHRNLVDTYLITHPHLDHISGFVINTAGLPGSRPKRLAGLPSTIAAFKTHIFNNVIWPNLSDENNGAGLVTYMRLVEGGSPALGEGEGKGYMEISDDLAVKVWGVSHGHCIEKHSHRGSDGSSRYGSMDASAMSMAMGPMGVGMGGNMPLMSPRNPVQHSSFNPNLGVILQQQQHRDQMHLASSQQGVLAGSSAPSGGQRAGSASGAGGSTETVCVYDSSAYFIRDMVTGREILMFGDVEPDSISLSPRNQQIWQEAAPKVATGKLAAVFIECSYDDSQSVDRLFGHLAPRFVMQEMASLAEEVAAARRQQAWQQEARDAAGSQAKAPVSGLDKRKRKREEGDSRILTRRRAAARMAVSATSSPLFTVDDPVSPTTVRPNRESSTLSQAQSLPDEQSSMLSTPHLATPTAELSLQDVEMSAPATPASVPGSAASGPPVPFPLKGLKVVLIHLKEKLDGGPPVGDVILSELEEYEREAQLGCEFIISHSGDSMFF
ncbi:hypothetical protein CONLIGDRAFT_161471 [Coniochaeta ligniaria NRRL 30616]|uniref:Cyclic-AMP phosphodiesterase, class-II n=1 Tax=Coniochaeta ligniaria NRRL 30616 TaxID=1408157 RepID=A0A1J7IZ57_9PEZI|nr:hypothetical protein CONLIGDRAFT_161471 [Coniochaeta ligniaria NRRL 30616]